MIPFKTIHTNTDTKTYNTDDNFILADGDSKSLLQSPREAGDENFNTGKTIENGPTPPRATELKMHK